MSKKTFKRVALGVIVSMVIAPLAAIAPSQGAATTLLRSSTTGTIAASASTSAAAGTFSITLVERAAGTWAADQVIEIGLSDHYGDDTCEIRANTDGTPAGTVTVTGVSDTLFSVAGYEPELEVDGGELVISIEGDYTDALEAEHITISGLTVRCAADAPIGNIYAFIDAGNAAVATISVTMSGTANQFSDVGGGDDYVEVRIADGNFPPYAAYQSTNNVYVALTDWTGRVRETVEDVYVSPLWVNPLYPLTGIDADEQVGGADGSGDDDVLLINNHGLRTGDAVVITDGDGTALLDDTVYYAIIDSEDTLALATSLTNAVAGDRVDFINDATDVHAYYAGSGAPVTLDLSTNASDEIYPGSAVTWPASSVMNDAFGTARSDYWLGKIGTVGATVNVYTTGTQTAFEPATNFTTTATEGELNIDAITGGAILDGLTVNPSIVVTLTNGVFQTAPTVTGGTISGTQTYPSATLTFRPTAENIQIVGTYRFNAGTTAGTYLTAAVAVNNTTAPVVYTAATQTTRIGVLSAATGAAVTQVSLSTGAANVAGPVVTITESAAGTFRAGRYVSICFADTAGNDLFNVDSKFVWATVTAGDLKLEGNVTTLRATMNDDSLGGTTTYDGTANQCAQVRVFGTSTAASTITWTAGSATAAEAATPFHMNVGSANGVVRMGIAVGTAADNGQLYGNFTVGSRTTANNYTVSVGSATSVALPASGAAVPDVTLVENTRGRFVAGTITVQLSNSLGVDNNISAFAATTGANAPVVTQTNAASDISWTYAVIADRVTITIASASTNVPATFRISNIKLNVASTTASGLAVTDNDMFAVVSGASVANNSWYLKLANVAPAEAVVEPVAPELAITKNNGRVFLTGLCQIDEGDVVVYVKSPGKAWKELAKTAECFAGAFDADRIAPKTPKLYRVKQEGTGLFSNQVLVRP